MQDGSCRTLWVMTVGDGNTGYRINEIVIEADSFLTRTLFRNIDKTISH